MSFAILAYLTGLIVVVFALLAWLRHRDPFHPMFFIGPMLIFLYSGMPLMLSLGEPEQLRGYLSEGELVYVQTLNLIGTLCICAGILLGSGPALTWQRPQAPTLPPAVSKRLSHAALLPRRHRPCRLRLHAGQRRRPARAPTAAPTAASGRTPATSATSSC